MDYQAKSKQITLSLLTSPEYQKSRSIHIYNSLKSEPDTQYIINHAKKSSRDIYKKTREARKKMKNEQTCAYIHA